MADPLTPGEYLHEDAITLTARVAASAALDKVRGLAPITADTHPDDETDEHRRAGYEAEVVMCAFMKALAEDPFTANRTAADLWGEMSGEKYPEWEPGGGFSAPGECGPAVGP